jgi:hypothetical protein
VRRTRWRAVRRRMAQVSSLLRRCDFVL